MYASGSRLPKFWIMVILRPTEAFRDSPREFLDNAPTREMRALWLAVAGTAMFLTVL